MDTQRPLSMSKEDFLALAEQKYHDLQQLKEKPTLYDYEKSFDEMWQELGRTDQGYKKNKLARLFGDSSLRESPVLNRGGRIESSVFVAHLGGAADFRTKFKAQADGYKSLGRDFVFISDGAIWLRQLMTAEYPEATLILDFYHRTGDEPHWFSGHGSLWQQ